MVYLPAWRVRHQFDVAGRGFSIRFDAALDMRMDQRQTTTAADILKNFTEQQLHKMLEQYGEVTNAKTLAKTIVEKRAIMPIKTINEFRQAVHQVVKGNPQKYFAQVFQALRIEVNDELGALQELLQQLPAVLKAWRTSSHHHLSFAGRQVGQGFFKAGSFSEAVVDDVYGGRQENPLRVITKKPVLAGEKETKQNTRSRSAKLRVAEKK